MPYVSPGWINRVDDPRCATVLHAVGRCTSLETAPFYIQWFHGGDGIARLCALHAAHFREGNPSGLHPLKVVRPETEEEALVRVIMER